MSIALIKAFVMADPARKSGVVIFANGQDALNVAKPIIKLGCGKAITPAVPASQLTRTFTVFSGSLLRRRVHLLRDRGQFFVRLFLFRKRLFK
jgi:hypothetical protein